MSQPFLQIHTLTSYPSALLNRDDAGMAKRIPFGGATRTRISSQCLKRHWRTFEGEHSLGTLEADGEAVDRSLRSRRTFEREVLGPLLQEVDEALAVAVTHALMETVLGLSPKKKAEKAAKGEEAAAPEARTEQVTVLGAPELRFLLDEARKICAAEADPKKIAKAVKAHFKGPAKKNLAELKRGAGLDAALFGRMVTSDILARCDAAVHVAHAFTVHAEASETDYFTAVDDLITGGDDAELGTGHIGNTELTSGLYYSYAVVDVPLLVSNLEGCKRERWRQADLGLAADVVARLPHLLATVSPGAKLGSTAPYAYAHLVLLEAGKAQPRTLANAFLKPVAERTDLLSNAYTALAAHLGDLDSMYGAAGDRRYAALGPVAALEETLPVDLRLNLPALASWAANQVRGR